MKYHNCGVFAGKIAMMVVAVDYLFFLLLELLLPREQIDTAPDFDPVLFEEYCKDSRQQ
jgi:phosphatidylinositol glycan class A protein